MHSLSANHTVKSGNNETIHPCPSLICSVQRQLHACYIIRVLFYTSLSGLNNKLIHRSSAARPPTRWLFFSIKHVHVRYACVIAASNARSHYGFHLPCVTYILTYILFCNFAFRYCKWRFLHFSILMFLVWLLDELPPVLAGHSDRQTLLCILINSSFLAWLSLRSFVCLGLEQTMTTRCRFNRHLHFMVQSFCLRPFFARARLMGLGLVSVVLVPVHHCQALSTGPNFYVCRLTRGRLQCMRVCPRVRACLHVFAIWPALLLHGLVLWVCFVVHQAGGRLLKSVACLAVTAGFYDLFVLHCRDIARV